MGWGWVGGRRHVKPIPEHNIEPTLLSRGICYPQRMTAACFVRDAIIINFVTGNKIDISPSLLFTHL